METLKTVPLSHIAPDPNQPRQEFDPAELALLKESIEKHGVMNPLIVEKKGDKYLIVDGERRFRASTALKLKELPVVIISGNDEEMRLIKRFHLQEQHKGWTLFDKAMAVSDLQKKQHLTIDELAAVLGLKRATVNDYMTMLTLSARVRSFAQEKRLPFVYLSALGYMMKRLEDKNLVKPLEDAMMKKIEDGLVQVAGDIDKYTVAIRLGGDKIAEKIIKQANYTPAQAGRETNTDSLLGHRRFMIVARNAAKLAAFGMKVKSAQHLNSDQVKDLKALKQVLDKYLDESPV